MTPIDEAALKAGISDEEIMEIADRWFCTGENQHKSDGYYYRSLGTPTNVRGSDLIEFARALLNRSQSEAPGIARAQQVLREMHEVNKGQQVADPFLFAALALDTVVPAEQAEDSAMRKDAERYRHLKSQSYKQDQDGGWLGSFLFYPVPAWDDTPYSKTRKQAFHFNNLDAAIDAAMSNREAGGS